MEEMNFNKYENDMFSLDHMNEGFPPLFDLTIENSSLSTTKVDNGRFGPLMSEPAIIKTEPEWSKNIESELSVPCKRQFSLRKINWSEDELILLNGFVIKYFAVRHSMKEGKHDKKFDKDKNVTFAWYKIHLAYEKARLRRNELTGREYPYRTANALSKKWKDSACKEEEEADDSESMKYLFEFIQKYNKDNILTCSDSKYEELKRNMKKRRIN